VAGKQDFTLGVDHRGGCVMESSTDAKDVLQFHLYIKGSRLRSSFNFLR
jgi:hypothetical protein